MASETTFNWIELAANDGQHSRDAYWQEFDALPETDDPFGSRDSEVGIWADSAWRNAWHDLKDIGATEDKESDCHKAFLAAFWNDPTTP